MFVTQVFGVLVLAVLTMSASMPQLQQDDSNPKPRMMTWEQHRANLATSGWIIIQQRNDVDDTNDLFKDAKWKAYKEGFWNLDINNKSFDDKKDAGYWMGLEKMHQMTKKGKWQLLTSYEFDKNKPYTTDGGIAVVIYNDFKVEDELQLYRLSLGSVQLKRGRYLSKSTDSDLRQSNDKMFSTKDKDADFSTSCATSHEGGWWFYGCASFCSNCNSNYVFWSNEQSKWLPVVKTVMAIKPMPDS